MKRALITASVASMIAQFNMDNIRILQEMGYQVDVAANFQQGNTMSDRAVRQFRQKLEQNEIGVYDLPIPRNIFDVKNILLSTRLMYHLVREKYYKIVHCQSPVGGVISRLACRKIRKNGTRVIYTAHGFHFYKGAPWKNWIFFYPVEWICSFGTDVLITINREDYQLAKKLHAAKSEFVPGVGIYTDDFLHIRRKREEVRKGLHISDHDFLFMSIGELVPRKNHRVALESLSRINDSHVKYVIVGLGEPERKKQIEKWIADWGLEDRVILAGYREDVKEFLAGADAFIFPSLQEGLPVSLMEAMASGLPIVCSRIRGNIDLIHEGKGGYLCGSENVEEFTVAIKKVMEDGEDKREEMKRYNLEMLKRFDVKIVKEKMKRIYGD